MGLSEKRHPDSARAAHRRQQVLEAAEGCFGRSGFHGASMADISKAAGMSAGHIYNYFDSKEAIIAAFVQQNVERVSALMQDFDRSDDPLQALLDGTDRHVSEVFGTLAWKMPLEIYAEASRNPKIAALLQQADAQTRSQFLCVLRRARERRGLATGDAFRSRVEVLISMFQGLQLRVLHHPGQDQAPLAAALRMAAAPLLFAE